jgi:hypothetical protein
MHKERLSSTLTRIRKDPCCLRKERCCSKGETGSERRKWLCPGHGHVGNRVRCLRRLFAHMLLVLVLVVLVAQDLALETRARESHDIDKPQVPNQYLELRPEANAVLLPRICKSFALPVHFSSSSRVTTAHVSKHWLYSPHTPLPP